MEEKIIKNCQTCKHNGLWPKVINANTHFLFCDIEKCSYDNKGYDIAGNFCADYEVHPLELDMDDDDDDGDDDV